MIPTLDPGIFILEQTADRTVYQATTGETWEITGVCTACGECEVGAVDTYRAVPLDSDRKSEQPEILRYQIWTGVPVGQPGACLDTRFGSRLDIPVRPEMTEKLANCALSGRYLDAN